MGDHPEGTRENGTRDGDEEGDEGGETVPVSVAAGSGTCGEGSRPPADEPGDAQPIGLDLAGFKRIYIGKILNPKQVCPLHYRGEDRCG
ncbi:hypothetical protein E2C01_072369 [Portunus trituberculatus]|uniref:Uncharacterized protein n=1 Tax=Portunus trituberculatus TaxID=210409 RepID=A0A5B7HZP6_PORTR|nr:hypothetical protein [Portunus trituberculatus]